jgi:arylsulfatase A-like enzyme
MKNSSLQCLCFRPWILPAFLTLLFPAAVLGDASPPPERPSPRPNILFIMADDHASHAMSCYGSKLNRTPNLDRLAGEGMRFANCFCTNALCGPSRAVILTGKYSHINGFVDNHHEFSRFDNRQQTVVKLLRKAGYQTAVIGKWHLRCTPEGFDYWQVLPNQGDYYDPVMIEMGKRRKHKGYVTDVITDLTLEFLKTKRDPSKPFFVCCHHKAPHRSWEPGPKHKTLYSGCEIPEPETLHDDHLGQGTAASVQTMDMKDLKQRDLKAPVPKGLSTRQEKKWRYQRYIKDYLRCVASVDENVGRVLNYLQESGLADNTVVFYTSDQGIFIGDHGWFSKRLMYEESLRMPLLVRWPGHVRPGSVCDAMVLNLDFAETFLDIAGLPIPRDMQGRSLMPLLEGVTPANWRTSMYYRYYDFPGYHHVHKCLGVRTGRHKLIFYPELDEWELFDLEKDPHELTSVYDDPTYATVVRTLKAELARLKQEFGDDDSTVGRVWKGNKEKEKARATKIKARARELRGKTP